MGGNRAGDGGWACLGEEGIIDELFLNWKLLLRAMGTAIFDEKRCNVWKW